MKEHGNLYYLFLEDLERTRMPEAQRKQMLKKLQRRFRKSKPPPSEDLPVNKKQTQT